MDEPCSALDPIATARIEELMRDLKRIHDRDRHPQHAAGRARLRPHRVLHGRGARRATATAPASWSSSTTPTKIFTQPGRRAHRGLHHRPLRLTAAPRRPRGARCTGCVHELEPPFVPVGRRSPDPTQTRPRLRATCTRFVALDLRQNRGQVRTSRGFVVHRPLGCRGCPQATASPIHAVGPPFGHRVRDAPCYLTPFPWWFPRRRGLRRRCRCPTPPTAVAAGPPSPRSTDISCRPGPLAHRPGRAPPTGGPGSAAAQYLAASSAMSVRPLAHGVARIPWGPAPPA